MENNKAIILIVVVLAAGLVLGGITGYATKQRDFGIGSSCFDNDNDLYFAQPGCGSLVDCNDNNALVNPSGVERCGNYIDENCDGIDPICR